MISAILLAAGESRRMGDFKQLLMLDGKTFVEHCADTLLASRVDEIVIVTGHREQEVRLAIGGRSVSFAHNPDYGRGMASSIKCGVQAVSKTAVACVVALVDQPLITSELIDRLIDTFEKTRPLIVIPTFDGRNGHPILFDLSLREEVLNMDIDRGLREVVRSHFAQIARVDASTSAVVEDFDFPEDYQRLLER